MTKANDREDNPALPAPDRHQGCRRSPIVDGTAAQEILRGVTRLLSVHAIVSVGEMSLPGGRRADVVGLSREGTVTIVEIKSCVADFRSDDKWREYLGHCDQLYFAVDPAFPHDILPADVGLILADRYGGDFMRDPTPRPRLSAGRRKAITLRFALIAASRLTLINDPEARLAQHA